MKRQRGGGIPIIDWNLKLVEAQSRELTKQDKSNLLAYPTGGVVCGLWRKKVLIENDIRFPENMFYEDNYWSAMLMPYLKKVCFVEEVHYYYRKNPNSTVHLKNNNDAHKSNRMMIEDMILKDSDNRGLYLQHKDAYDYGYIYRRTFNTWKICVSRYDQLDSQFIKSLFSTMKNRLPNWEKNSYYIEMTPLKWRFVYKLTSMFPICFSRLGVIFKTIKRVVNKLK